jgi:23S rRNA (adenine2503-C2)-methyltransferase
MPPFPRRENREGISIIFALRMTETQPDIRKMSLADLQAWFELHKQPKFRAKQVFEWLWKKSATDFDQMTNISLDLRNQLKEHFSFRPLLPAESQKSSDRTIKTAFKLHDGQVVEGVLIPTATRMTACISSQAGCSLTCKFCATGKLKLIRNLDAAEIYDQVAFIRKQSEQNYSIPLSNIVYMGMGEPLLNYKNVIESIEKITSPEGLGMSPQRITVSTAGISKMIRKLGDDEVKFHLALSLHAANDEKRSKIMPINESNSLDELADALLYFYNKTGTRPTLEYIIFKDFNDSLEDAAQLERFSRRVPTKINIIEYNPIGEGEFQKADEAQVNLFVAFLEKKGVIVNVRRSRGKDIDAACGQLANKNKAVSNVVRKAEA